MFNKVIIFLIINFSALAIGQVFTGKGVVSEWYQLLDKAPWTPPGWVFGAAWTTIMICFSVYMAYAWEKISKHRSLLFIFVVQWILNVAWNPVFFYFQNVLLGLAVITSLTGVVVGIFLLYKEELKTKSFLIVPYGLWLLIATSLNAYILVMNP